MQTESTRERGRSVGCGPRQAAALKAATTKTGRTKPAVGGRTSKVVTEKATVTKKKVMKAATRAKKMVMKAVG